MQQNQQAPAPVQQQGGQGVPVGGNVAGDNAQGQNVPPGAIQMTQEQFDMIQQLVGSPEFQAIRQQAQQNPQIIPQLLQFLQQTNPQLFQLLSQNPNLLAALLLGQGEGGNLEGEYAGEEGAEVDLDLTDEDYAAIETVS